MTVALIVAAGSGERLGAARPKALVELAGRPLLQWSIDAVSQLPGLDRIVVAMPPGAPAPAGVTAVAGGACRSESVALALAAAGPGETVLVHDAARPLVSVELLKRTIAALHGDASADAAIAAASVTDTIKRVDEGGGVTETLDRGALWAVQTPQVFRRDALERALDIPREELERATDDAWLIERAGGRVIVVPAQQENLKVTTPADLQVAEMLIARRAGTPS
jgi:2-C-methyl-D-erythritol 4-phosphate cytidylyltransferase